MYTECYYPPINVCHLGSKILVPTQDVYDYSKSLYEKGREAKSILPVGEAEAMKYFRWKARLSRLGPIKRWIIEELMK